MSEIPVSSAGSETAGRLCAICQSGIVAGERILHCPSCDLPFHEECWNENRGCSAYGCKSAPITSNMKPTLETTSNAWGDKQCPSCLRKIKAEALKCRFCGAIFETRDIITRQEFATREYDGQEYNAARNKVVMLFILSVLGCLAPVGIIMTGILIFSGEILGVSFRRLPGALKALAWAGFGIGCLLMFLLVVFLAVD